MPLQYSRDSIADLQSLLHKNNEADNEPVNLSPSDYTVADFVVEEVEVHLQPITFGQKSNAPRKKQNSSSTLTNSSEEPMQTSTDQSFDYVDYYDESYDDSYTSRGNLLRSLFPFFNKRLKSKDVDMMTATDADDHTVSKTMSSRQVSIHDDKPVRHDDHLNVYSVHPMKSILKNATNFSAQFQGEDDIIQNSPHNRRSILPNYNTSVMKTFRKDRISNMEVLQEKNVAFNTMAKVIHVLSISEMSYATKTRIWWQRTDYDEFKKTGRVISKAMLQGGSEIWLLRTVDHEHALHNDNETKDGTDQSIDKWWCKFGHSRRGLEHVVSIEEGRQRQKLVDGSIRAVLDEQARQRNSNKSDTMKLAAVSMQYTTWAKDLALAAAAADADAVQSDFDTKAKCRLEHLRMKMNMTSLNQDSQIPCANFILATNSALQASLLDANI